MSPLARPPATKLRRRVRQLPLCKCRSEQGWCSPALRLLPHVAALFSVQLSLAAVFSLRLRELSDRGRLERLRPWWQIKEVSPSSSSPSLASSSSLTSSFMMIANANHLSVAVFADGVVPTLLFPFPPARQPIGDGVMSGCIHCSSCSSSSSWAAQVCQSGQ